MHEEHTANARRCVQPSNRSFLHACTCPPPAPQRPSPHPGRQPRPPGRRGRARGKRRLCRRRYHLRPGADQVHRLPRRLGRQDHHRAQPRGRPHRSRLGPLHPRPGRRAGRRRHRCRHRRADRHFGRHRRHLTAADRKARAIMSDRYIVPRRLDDPELIGFWTIDEFAGMIVPFTWGILAQHIFIGIGSRLWRLVRTAKGESRTRWLLGFACRLLVSAAGIPASRRRRPPIAGCWPAEGRGAMLARIFPRTQPGAAAPAQHARA